MKNFRIIATAAVAVLAVTANAWSEAPSFSYADKDGVGASAPDASSILGGGGAPSLSKLKWTALAQQKGANDTFAPVKIDAVNPTPEPATIAALGVAAASLLGRAGRGRNTRYRN
ncbi:MAG: hypothetical protein ACOYON_12650 [Fimbriimonas sp.]